MYGRQVCVAAMSVTAEHFLQPNFGKLPSFMKRLFGPGQAAPAGASTIPFSIPRTSQTPYGARSFVSAGQGPLTVIFESGLGDGKEAVSYTHLDVYKRQPLPRVPTFIRSLLKSGNALSGSALR